METQPPTPIQGVKRIAIIGAGPTGLIVLKKLIAEEAFDLIDVFEMRSEVGGVWASTPVSAPIPLHVPFADPDVPLQDPVSVDGQGKPAFPTPMYEGLFTNIPKEMMSLKDQKFGPGADLFPSRRVVEQFLLKLASDIRSYIRLSTQVRNVEHHREAGRDRWTVSTKDLQTGQVSRTEYDAVVVANGHFNVPYIPPISGLEDWNAAYPGAISHTINYKSPATFKDKKTVVFGGGPSGVDIIPQIARVAVNPVLLSIRSAPFRAGTPAKEVAPIKELIVKDQAVRFTDGTIEENVQRIMFATGYLYSYPFIQPLEPPLTTDGLRVRGLYKQLVRIATPTLAFSALQVKAAPFPLAEVQGAVLAKLWSGKLGLPSRAQMEAEEAKQVEERGEGMAFHALGGVQVLYANELRDWASAAEAGVSGKVPSMWEDDARTIWIATNFNQLRIAYGDKQGVKTPEELGFSYEAYQEAQKVKASS